MATKTNGKAPRNNGASSAVAAIPIEVEPLNQQIIQFEVVGTSPLVMHQFGPKERRHMLEAQTSKKTKSSRELRCPVGEFLDSAHWVDCEPPKPDSVEDGVPQWKDTTIKKCLKESSFGIPLTAFKNAMISAARNTDLTMTQLRQQLFVTSPVHHEYAIVKGVPIMDNRIVRINKKIPMERFRMMFEQWETTIQVLFDANKLHRDTVANLLAIAGFYVGVLEGRPEKSALGWGRFEIASK